MWLSKTHIWTSLNLTVAMQSCQLKKILYCKIRIKNLKNACTNTPILSVIHQIGYWLVPCQSGESKLSWENEVRGIRVNEIPEIINSYQFYISTWREKMNTKMEALGLKKARWNAAKKVDKSKMPKFWDKIMKVWRNVAKCCCLPQKFTLWLRVAFCPA